jgi:hypothetical protein
MALVRNARSSRRPVADPTAIRAFAEAATAYRLLRLRASMKLEARFHPPLPTPRGYIVVGHVMSVRDETGERVHVEPAESLARQTAPATILATLRHLVTNTSRRSLDRLEKLRSRYWSFVRVGTEAPRAQDQ